MKQLLILILWVLAGCTKPTDRWSKMNQIVESCPSHQASCLDEKCVCITPTTVVAEPDEALQSMLGPDVRLLIDGGTFVVHGFTTIGITYTGTSWYDEQGNPILPHEAFEIIRDMGFAQYDPAQKAEAKDQSHDH